MFLISGLPAGDSEQSGGQGLAVRGGAGVGWPEHLEQVPRFAKALGLAEFTVRNYCRQFRSVQCGYAQSLGSPLDSDAVYRLRMLVWLFSLGGRLERRIAIFCSPC